MPSQIIQWFPGHMAKTRRMISENLKNCDIVIELLDARIPASSKNPEIAALTEGKPVLTLLNKSTLASPDVTKKWVAHYAARGAGAIPIDCVKNENMQAVGTAVREILRDKIKRFEEKGMSGRRLRAMIVGIPNVGKSTFVNRLSKSKKAKVEDRPGVTLNKQWITTDMGFDLLDMPGILWPKFEDRVTGENLALTGAIKDAILDTEELACILCSRLAATAPREFSARYKLTDADIDGKEGYEILETVGRKRGFLISGGEIDTERCSLMLLDEFRGCKIGRISLEVPEV